MFIEQQQVKAFMLQAEQDCPDKPVIPPLDIQALRLKIIQEELDELDSAFADKNLVEVADAIADLLVVVIGTAIACGINIEPIWTEVMNSNMSKFIDGHKREDGKWIKGPSCIPANIKPLIQEQIEGRIKTICQQPT
jgi:predicted HAD superfamily Cof-like phosphohydrolase